MSQFDGLHETEEYLRTRKLADLSEEDFLQTKKRGFSDPQIARAVGESSASCLCACIWGRHLLACSLLRILLDILHTVSPPSAVWTGSLVHDVSYGEYKGHPLIIAFYSEWRGIFSIQEDKVQADS